MYRFILGVFALTFIASAANASPLLAGRDVRLHLQVRNFAAGGQNPSTEVRRNGQVVTQTCQAIYPKPCRVLRVEQLSARQMDRIERLIDLSRKGVPVKTQGMHCMAMPIENLRYTADNEKVFLKSVDRPCGLPTTNSTRAAAVLIGVLDKLQARAMNHSASDLDSFEIN